ncbi:hypothetical protein PybrP1_011720 [[Pythium] brassicae (nom. inval.)]|nr:hypothetical protein PybrP1_011720 [[Pythium] brassicae (nom. inval.)]
MASLSHPSSGKSHQECHICLEELRQELAACVCGHVFHHACILQALQVSSQCPICRRYVVEAHVVSLYFELPEPPSSATTVATIAASHHPDGGQGVGSTAHVEKLSERVSALVERLKWQKKQYDALSAELKRTRSQSEQLVLDKQGLLQRVAALEANKNVLVNKVAKYQMELSRQAEATRQMTINQSIISFLDSCDSDAMEEEIQNPRELIIALKKACKFRHDQYQKVVKEKTRLKAMLQSSQLQLPPQQSDSGKGKLRSSFDSTKRLYAEYTPPVPHPLELKKRKTENGPASVALPPSPADLAHFTPTSESAGFRANAYSDVSVRPVTAARPTFSRSSYNPNQYGAYNMTPANEPPVQASNHTVCRRGYDETGKLTNFFIPSSKDAKRGGGGSTVGGLKASGAGLQQRSMPGTLHLQGLSQSGGGLGNQQRAPPGVDRREFPLTNWLRKES